MSTGKEKRHSSEAPIIKGKRERGDMMGWWSAYTQKKTAILTVKSAFGCQLLFHLLVTLFKGRQFEMTQSI